MSGDIANVEVARRLLPRWPNAHDPEHGDHVLDELIGARIIAIGTMGEDVEGGGLVLVYQPQWGVVGYA